MARKQTVVNLDAIDQKKKLGFIGRALITRPHGGKRIRRMSPFGHYMFCGEQGSGKTASALWYAEKLGKKYKRRGKDIKFYSNIGIGGEVTKNTLFDIIDSFNPDSNEVRIVIVDEIQVYFPKDSIDKETRLLMSKLVAIFSQLRKRSTFVISTAQIYGRLDKSLREQCLYMIDCRVSRATNRLVNDFIPQKNIIADDLGRWAGRPTRIYTHGLSELKFDTKKIIRV